MSCLSPQLAVDFVSGALPVNPARAVELHMAECGDCRKLVVEVAKINMAEVGPDVSPDTANENVGHATTLLLKQNESHISELLSKSQPAGGGKIELVRGAQVGRYTLLYPLGEGGMGSVHAAFDPKLDRRVALKFLRTDLLASKQEGHRERLLREARALARLSHPNVVSIYDVAESGGSVFLAMELIDGNNARVWRELGDRSMVEIVKVYRESLNALMAAHEQGIIHRDFKPDNVMVGVDGIARVTDFGLACAALVDVDELLEKQSGSVDWDTLTQTGLAVGTPKYMAPEQFSGQATELTDQFSFCLSMYEALYGHYPLGTKTPRSLHGEQSIEQQILSPLAKGRIPDSLRRALLRGMSLDPQQRWPSSRELDYELSLASSPKTSGLKWAVAAALTATVAGAAFFFAPNPPPAVAKVDTSNYEGQLDELRGQVDKLSSVDQELLHSRNENKKLLKELARREQELAESQLEEEALAPTNRKARRSVRPPLPVQSVERSVTTRLSEVLACYDKHVEGEDEQTVRVKVGIAKSGKVKWVAPPFQGDRRASKCLERALKRLAFPASEVDTTATLSLSFFRLESGLLAVNMRAKTRNAELGQVTIDSKGRILVNCDPMDPLCGIDL